MDFVAAGRHLEVWDVGGSRYIDVLQDSIEFSLRCQFPANPSVDSEISIIESVIARDRSFARAAVHPTAELSCNANLSRRVRIVEFQPIRDRTSPADVRERGLVNVETQGIFLRIIGFEFNRR